MRFWIGARGADMGAEGAGVSAMTAGEADSPLASGPLGHAGVAVEASSPTWLAPHPLLEVVYAALEGSGRVAAFRRTGEATLAPFGAMADAGEAVCHLAVSPDGSRLIASCWGDGRVVHVPLRRDGALGDPVIAEAANDPYAADGASPGGAETDAGPAGTGRPSRAHSAAFLADGRVATTDLGYDLVRIWRIGASGLVPDHEVVLPFGVGPRHLMMHPSGHLHVVTEFSCEVWTLAEGRGGRWAVVGAAQTGALDGDTGAELTPSHDRRFLYAGLRGSDTIAVLRVAGEGDRLQPVALVESGARTPRHHVVVRDALLVAGQDSHEIVSLPVDERAGVPGAVRHRLETPCPQHLLQAGR